MKRIKVTSEAQPLIHDTSCCQEPVVLVMSPEERERRLVELVQMTQEFGGYPELDPPLIYTNYLGEVIEYPADTSPEIRAFLQRMQAAVDDQTVDASMMLELVYSPANPILTRVTRPDGTVEARVTHENFNDPLYSICQDMIFRKHEQQRPDPLRSRCRSCDGGCIQSTARPNRTMRFRDDVAVPVPDDFQLLECDQCGEIWVSPKDAAALDAVLAAEYTKRH